MLRLFVVLGGGILAAGLAFGVSAHPPGADGHGGDHQRHGPGNNHTLGARSQELAPDRRRHVIGLSAVVDDRPFTEFAEAVVDFLT